MSEERVYANRAVLRRDENKCVFCGEPSEMVHHLMERRLFPDGGYDPDNMITVCERHHWECEMTRISPQEGRRVAGIKRVVLPAHLEADQEYDKWGNPIAPDGRRGRGELFHTDGCQRALKRAGILHLYTRYVKYPRTPHLPWSYPGKGDLVSRKGTDDAPLWFNRDTEIVVTEKMDGQGITMYSDYMHARSIDSMRQKSQSWVRNLHGVIAFLIPDDFRVCGENLYAQHSIPYTELPSYFMVFSIWERDTCLSWDETVEWCELLGLTPVPVLYRGTWGDFPKERFTVDENTTEGYVVRDAGKIPLPYFRNMIAKYVRPNHVQTPERWEDRLIVNGIAKPGEPGERRTTKDRVRDATEWRNRVEENGKTVKEVLQEGARYFRDWQDNGPYLSGLPPREY